MTQPMVSLAEADDDGTHAPFDGLVRIEPRNRIRTTPPSGTM